MALNELIVLDGSLGDCNFSFSNKEKPASNCLLAPLTNQDLFDRLSETRCRTKHFSLKLLLSR